MAESASDDQNIDDFGPVLHLSSLGGAWPRILQLVDAQLSSSHRFEIAEQLRRTVIPAQRTGGTANDFSVMAFPLPRLNFDQRRDIDLCDPERIHCEFEGCSVTLALDDFGQINWLYISGIPDAFEKIAFPNKTSDAHSHAK